MYIYIFEIFGALDGIIWFPWLTGKYIDELMKCREVRKGFFVLLVQSTSILKFIFLKKLNFNPVWSVPTDLQRIPSSNGSKNFACCSTYSTHARMLELILRQMLLIWPQSHHISVVKTLQVSKHLDTSYSPIINSDSQSISVKTTNYQIIDLVWNCKKSSLIFFSLWIALHRIFRKEKECQ